MSVDLVHQCPPGDEVLTPCCGWLPTELPHTDRLTSDPLQVTCRAVFGIHDRRSVVPRTDLDAALRAYRRVCHRIAQVEALIDQAKQVSPSDRMTVYVGDLEQALGLRDEPARTRTGANG